jgi:hypothetical protein
MRQLEQPHFGGNLYRLFQMRHGMPDHPDALLSQQYAAFLLANRESWESFTATHAPLLMAIDMTLDLLAKYESLTRVFEAGSPLISEDELEAFDEIIWSRLNLLLQQAAQFMREAGIDPAAFIVPAK